MIARAVLRFAGVRLVDAPLARVSVRAELEEHPHRDPVPNVLSVALVHRMLAKPPARRTLAATVVAPVLAAKAFP